LGARKIIFQANHAQPSQFAAPAAGAEDLADSSCEARFLSVNENRLATGYRPVDGGDVFQPPK
jgi:hypothetical protein